MTRIHDPGWVRWPVAVLATVDAGWMAFDGARALAVGEFVTVDGQLGPWAELVSALGIEPSGIFMKVFFLVYGLAWLAATVVYLLRPAIGRRLMVIAAIGSIWYLVFGTVSSIIQLALLALGRRARLRVN